MSNFIDQYASGPEKLALAIRGLTQDDLLCMPAPDAPPEVGKWSIQQVVMHIADAEMAFAHRLKRVIAEENPTLQAWDENRFAERLFYNEQSAEDAVELVELIRRQMARLLRKIPPEGWRRFGTHSARGRETLTDIMNYAVSHIDHHVKFIHAKRAQMGKEIW